MRWQNLVKTVDNGGWWEKWAQTRYALREWSSRSDIFSHVLHRLSWGILISISILYFGSESHPILLLTTLRLGALNPRLTRAVSCSELHFKDGELCLLIQLYSWRPLVKILSILRVKTDLVSTEVRNVHTTPITSHPLTTPQLILQKHATHTRTTTNNSLLPP